MHAEVARLLAPLPHRRPCCAVLERAVRPLAVVVPSRAACGRHEAEPIAGQGLDDQVHAASLRKEPIEVLRCRRTAVHVAAGVDAEAVALMQHVADALGRVVLPHDGRQDGVEVRITVERIAADDQPADTPPARIASSAPAAPTRTRRRDWRRCLATCGLRRRTRRRRTRGVCWLAAPSVPTAPTVSAADLREPPVVIRSSSPPLDRWSHRPLGVLPLGDVFEVVPVRSRSCRRAVAGTIAMIALPGRGSTFAPPWSGGTIVRR